MKADILHTGLQKSEVERLRKQYGFNEIAKAPTSYLLLFFSKFWGLSAWMLELIIVLSFFLHRVSDACIVSGLLVFNAVIGFFQERRAANAVELLKKKLEINVRIRRDALWSKIPARELVPGDIIRVRIGDFIPADLKIAEGEVSVDQSALTGESGDAEKKADDAVYSGSVVTKGEATCIVTGTGSKTFFGKTVQLVETAKPKSHIEESISLVTRRLLLIVGVFLLIAFLGVWMQGGQLLEALPLMLVLLLGAIPVALTAMFTVSMALGSKELLREGVLITRLNAPDDAASMEILCVDKTGTLTTNRLSVAEILPAESKTKDEVILCGILASQEANDDSIDRAFIRYGREKEIATSSFLLKSFTPFDPRTRRTEALVQAGNGDFLVMKGSFKAIAGQCELSKDQFEELERKINELASEGYRTIAVAKAGINQKPGFMGIVALHDPPRADSADLVREIEGLGISVKMLTGDAMPIARQIAKYVAVGDKILRPAEYRDLSPLEIADLIQKNNGVAEVYPEDKFNIVKALQSKGIIVGMTGDGVNDAPALKQAEVGIAVSNATDVAKGAASVVLTREGLANILAPVKTGRRMFERINIWILNKIARTVLKTSFVVGAFLVLGKFIISASAMLIMIFLTDFAKISLSTDNVTWEKRPAKWKMKSLTVTGIIIGLLMAAEAFLLLYFGWTYYELGNNTEALSTFSFEILLFFALFSIFVVREKRHFWQSAPSKTLLFIIIGDMILGVAMATFGLLGLGAIPLSMTLTVVVYSMVCSFLINDWIKFALLKILGKEK